MAVPPPPPPSWQRWWHFFLVSLFRLKKRTCFRGSPFCGGVSAQNVSPPTKTQGPQCPLPHLNNRSYATALPAPAKRLVMWFLKYFIYHIHFALLKMFHNFPFFSFIDRFLWSFPHHLKLKKNEEPARWQLKKKKITKIIKFSKTADTEDYSTTLSKQPPPPPPLSLPVVSKGCVNWTSRSQRTLSRQPGGYYLESVRPSPFPPRPLPLPSPTLWNKVLVGFTIDIRLISSLGLGPWVRQNSCGGGGGDIWYCVPHLQNRGGHVPPPPLDLHPWFERKSEKSNASP